MGIKISKAIEILEREAHDITLSPDPDVPDALKLGVQTLEYYKELKRLGKIPRHFLLPGEDPEEEPHGR